MRNVLIMMRKNMEIMIDIQFLKYEENENHEKSCKTSKRWK